MGGSLSMLRCNERQVFAEDAMMDAMYIASITSRELVLTAQFLESLAKRTVAIPVRN